MDARQFINKIREKLPLAYARRIKYKKNLVNTNFTLFTPNCSAGHLYHDFGLEFKSPTINLSMTQTDFVKFLHNLDSYLSGRLIFKNSDTKYPIADLKISNNEHITINFTHYSNEKEATEKWNSRINRIDKSNMFAFVCERDGITREEIESLQNLGFKGLLVFTASNYNDIPYCLQLPKYSDMGETGNILKRSWIDDSSEFEHFFDFVKWFNEADGKNYDVKRFSKV